MITDDEIVVNICVAVCMRIVSENWRNWSHRIMGSMF